MGKVKASGSQIRRSALSWAVYAAGGPVLYLTALWLPRDTPWWSVMLGSCCGLPVAIVAVIAAYTAAHWHFIGRQRWWAEMQALRVDPVAQSRGDAAAREILLSRARACPKCRRPPTELAWIYYSSPPETWEQLCGRSGWIMICDHCEIQVDFMVTFMN